MMLVSFLEKCQKNNNRYYIYIVILLLKRFDVDRLSVPFQVKFRLSKSAL